MSPKYWRGNNNLIVLAEVSAIQCFNDNKLNIYLKSGQSIEICWSGEDAKSTRDNRAKSLADALEVFYLERVQEGRL